LKKIHFFNVIEGCNVSAVGGTVSSTENLTTTEITKPHYHFVCTRLCQILSDSAIWTRVMSVEYFQVQFYIC